MAEKSGSAGARLNGVACLGKTWWACGILFLALNAWAWNWYGVFAVLRFWAAFFALLGAAVPVCARRMKRYAAESLHWPPAQATELRSEMAVDRQTSFNEESCDPVRTMVYYHPEIEYEL